jgi:5'-methylthioadenosine phosphorylase
MTIKLGVIGGSGVYAVDDLDAPSTLDIATPFGRPSGSITEGTLNGMPVVFLPRHGAGHTLTPTEVPYRANVFALKSIGVTHLLSVSAVGSLREDYPPRSLVAPDQIIDRTSKRSHSFFEGGIVAHVGMADPFCAAFAGALADRAGAAGIQIRRGGTYVCVEGPQFSTRAESDLYRSWGASIIGMTAMPEARLAREAELCYAQLAMVTDFDVWHRTEEPVTVAMVIENLKAASTFAVEALKAFCAGGATQQAACACDSALANAITTDPVRIPQSVRDRLAPIAGKYLG